MRSERATCWRVIRLALLAAVAGTLVVACGGAVDAATTDAAHLSDAATADTGSDTMLDASVGDAALEDAALHSDATALDANTEPDSSAELDAATDDAGIEADASIEQDASTQPDASTEADAGTEPDASVEPSAYRLEVWGFTVPSMRRRFQIAAPGYTNWQTHDPEASLLAKRGPDVIAMVGTSTNRSAVYDNTLTLSASESIVAREYSSLASLALASAGFVDYEQNGDITPIPVAEIEPLTSCAVGWMSAEQVADTLATGNIQTSTCPAPVHAGSGTAMFNADFQIDWRIVAVP
jgi:hypothetical protein